MNEREAVVISMNLIKSSWPGSLELGFVVEGDAHQQLVIYLRETLRVVIAAKEIEAKKNPAVKTKKSTTKPTRKHQLCNTVVSGSVEAVTALFDEVVEHGRSGVELTGKKCTHHDLRNVFIDA
jgi:hypothetical protein